MGRELRRMHLQYAALGAGGWERLGPAEYGRVGGVLRADYRRLVSFANDIANGQESEAAVLARVAMYIGNARRQFWTLDRERARPSKPGFVLMEIRVLGGITAEHCSDCVAMAGQWQPFGALPLPGEESACLTHCQCTLVRKEVPAEQAAEMGETADLFNPYHDARGRFTTKTGAVGRSAGEGYAGVLPGGEPAGYLPGTPIDEAWVAGRGEQLLFALQDEQRAGMAYTLRTVGIPREHYEGLRRIDARDVYNLAAQDSPTAGSRPTRSARTNGQWAIMSNGTASSVCTPRPSEKKAIAASWLTKSATTLLPAAIP
jgi:hypothetical protein